MKKNVIVLFTDQQQKNTIRPNHPCITPAVEELAKESVWFERSYASNAICSPSRASFMTGMLPHNHGMVDCTHTVPSYRAEYDSNLDTMTRVMKDQGYAVSYYGKWHIERTHKLENYGFDAYVTEQNVPKFDHTPLEKITVQTDGYRDRVVSGVFAEGMESTEEYYLYSKAIDFIQQHKDDDAPWCTFVSTYAPHDPYTVPKEIWDMYDGVDLPIPESYRDTLSDKPNVYKRIQGVWKDLSEADCKSILRSYYSYCTSIDTQVARLVAYLKENDLYDDTLIVYVSDHGDLMGGHGLFCKGVPAFEEGYSIPLFMKLPQAMYGGTTCDTLLNSHDIAPTILDAIGLPALRNPIDGQSMMPWVKGETSEPRCAFSEFFGQRLSYTQRIVWKDKLKYVYNGFDFDEFYDLEADPHEQTNQINNPAYAQQIHELCSEMWNRIVESGDDTMIESQYFMMRFAPTGPDLTGTQGGYAVYNKTF